MDSLKALLKRAHEAGGEEQTVNSGCGVIRGIGFPSLEVYNLEF